MSVASKLTLRQKRKAFLDAAKQRRAEIYRHAIACGNMSETAAVFGISRQRVSILCHKAEREQPDIIGREVSK